MASATLKDKLSSQFAAAKTSQDGLRPGWEDAEQLALTELANSDQNKRKSRISIGDLSTIVLERSGRTVAQLPSGKVRPVSEVDEGTCRLLELALQRYVIPNANDQYSLEEKVFLVDYLSDVYGGLDVLSYWRVDDEYVGPDCQILSPRDVFWQAGKRNKKSAEYVFVSTFVSVDWLKQRAKSKQWKSGAINKVIKQIEDNAAKPSAREDSNRQTVNDARQNQTTTWGDTQEIELVTKYERNGKRRWISFLPDFDNEVVRNISPNHPFPVISKLPLLPQIDSIQGQGAFKRGASLQKTLDSITNLTHDGLKFAIFPITKYKGSVVKRSTLKWQPGGFWNMSDLDAVSEHSSGNRVLSTFLPIQQFLGAKMLNQNGTTSTQVAETDKVSGYGKTPKALELQSQRESTMDRLARKRLEAFYGDLIESWISLLCSKQEKPFEFYVYDEEINQLKAMGHEVELNKGYKSRKNARGKEVIVFGSAKCVIKKGDMKGKYRFIVDTSSSMMQDESEEHERLSGIMSTILQVGGDNIDGLLSRDGETLKFSEIFKRWIITSGVKDWDSFFQDVPIQNVPPEGVVAETGAPLPTAPMPTLAPSISMPQTMPLPPGNFSEYQPDPFTQQVVDQIRNGGL